ncbi:preprotein translocase subunit SecE [Vagococcus carniphilus]|uniref:Preprotein translocase subunit SecE n=1 Tax=Vagococcus carniphilus TaxID=218144 RepID=A0A430B9J3_9ENTE|nr:preprotein translocase subunit SecE [Vagococcus carniphilus]QNN73570.1 preprotein translocase subunit SecE [Vagococcus carniphilus]RSU16907.1 preprotein translocase subunit SecE [Vagococcus carniphilus]
MKFLKSVKVEMQEVTWPSKAKLSKDVVTVIQSTLLFAAFFAVSDFAIDFVMKLFV